MPILWFLNLASAFWGKVYLVSTNKTNPIFASRKIDPTRDRDGALARNEVAVTLGWFGNSFLYAVNSFSVIGP